MGKSINLGALTAAAAIAAEREESVQPARALSPVPAPVQATVHDGGVAVDAPAPVTEPVTAPAPVQAAPRRAPARAASPRPASPRPASPRAAGPRPAAGEPKQAKWSSLARKEVFLWPDQRRELSMLEMSLNERRGKEGERITANSLIRVAVDLLLERQDDLGGATEDDLRAALGLARREQ